ncbi:MAG: FecR domain-containing protein [Planctomycetes bacterium]|nr:FecR domain-containing protein [Planctomycetota bacterium]
MAELEPDDPRDRMVDMLLWETIGGQEPPNLVGPIMRRATAMERSRKLRLVFTVAAAAALVGLAISGYLWITQPPAQNIAEKEKPPEIKTPEELKTAPAKTEEPKFEEWGRGTLVQTSDKPKTGMLGGYAKVEAAANTSIRIEGKEKAEQILVEKGQVACSVEKKIGSFTVRTPAGYVFVTGTRFEVTVPQGDGEHHTDAAPRQMALAVTEGSVQLCGEYGKTVFEAGEQGGCFIGPIAKKGEEFISVRMEGEHEPVRFLPRQVERKLDPALMEKLRDAKEGSRVQFAWKTIQGQRRIVGMQVFDHGPKTGRFIGVIQEKAEEGIRVKNDDGKLELFRPQWIGGQPQLGGGLDKEMQGKLAHLNRGDRVRIDWVFNEGMRIVQIEKLKEGER